MAAVSAASQLLRADRATWERHAVMARLSSASLVAMGAYAVLAFDRFGLQGLFAPRATIRMLLTGFYGWLWLAAASWVIARLVLSRSAPFPNLFRLYGLAHLPLLIVAITIQFFSIALQMSEPALAVAAFAFVVWMPALLVAAARQAFDLETRRALVVVALPYLVWLLVVGRSLGTQLGHLV